MPSGITAPARSWNHLDVGASIPSSIFRSASAPAMSYLHISEYGHEFFGPYRPP